MALESEPQPNVICIAAALIDDGDGRVFLVRKAGTAAFMQAGGKIERDETPLEALMRELDEELGFSPAASDPRYIGCYSAVAANEPDHRVEAHVFHIRAARRGFTPSAELAEAVWVSLEEAARLDLAPLTRQHVLPAAKALAAPASNL